MNHVLLFVIFIVSLQTLMYVNGDDNTDANNIAVKFSEFGEKVLGISQIKAQYDSLTGQNIEINGTEAALNIALQTATIIGDRAKVVMEVAAKVSTLYETNTGKTSFTQCCALTNNLVYDFRFRSKISTGNYCVRLPQGHPTSYASMTSSSQADIRVSNDLGTFLLQKSQQYDTMKWLFFGANSGIHTLGPAGLKSKCDDYDPRYRPWYVAASTVPKLVILVIDSSGSMSASGRMDAAKNAAKAVLATLNPKDWVNVIDFDSSARASPQSSCGSGYTLLQATAQNIDMLNKFVDTLEADGGTDFGSAFKTAYDMLTRTRTTYPQVSSMPSAIVFMTDGESTAPTAVKPVNPPVIFSFALGGDVGDAAKKILQDLATGSGGEFKVVPDGSASELRTAMASYYLHPKFLSESNQKVVAVTSPFYSSGLGTIIALAYPVFSNGAIRGVVGVDVSLSEFVSTTTEFNGRDGSYAFILDTNGYALSHPNLPLSYAVGSEQTRVHVSTLEDPTKQSDDTGLFMSNIVASMMNNETGKAHFKNITRYLPRGEGTEGTVTVVVDGTYYWTSVPIPNTSERVQVAVFVVDPVYQNTLRYDSQPIPATKSVYHRFDLLDDYGGEATTVFNERRVTTKKSIIFFSNRLYVNPEKYLEGSSQTKDDVIAIQNFVNTNSEYPKLKPAAQNEARISSAVDLIWKSGNSEFGAASPDDVSWRYIGTTEGSYRIFPGVEQSRYYDPILRPWFKRAMLFPGNLTLTLRNKFTAADGIVYSLTKSLIVKGSSSPTVVVGCDFSSTKFSKLMKDNAQSCKQQRCLLADTHGYIIYDSLNDTMKVPLPIGQVLPELTTFFLSNGQMTRSSCNDYGSQATKVELSLSGVKQSGTASLTYASYTFIPLPDTNVIFISTTASSKNQPESSFCKSSTCSVTAVNIYGGVQTDICPCSLSIDYSNCNAGFLVTQFRPLCAVAAPPLPRDLEQDIALPDWALGLIIASPIVVFIFAVFVACKCKRCRRQNKQPTNGQANSQSSGQQSNTYVPPPATNNDNKPKQQKTDKEKDAYENIPVAVPIEGSYYPNV